MKINQSLFLSKKILIIKSFYSQKKYKRNIGRGRDQKENLKRKDNGTESNRKGIKKGKRTNKMVLTQ
jgi:hypothetical protein